MTTHTTQDRPPVITATWILLVVYSLLYWPAKFFRDHLPGFMSDFFQAIVKHWYLITFLEFLAVVSLFVDIVIRWDRMSPRWRKIQLVITCLLVISFVTRVITGMMELLLTGVLK